MLLSPHASAAMCVAKHVNFAVFLVNLAISAADVAPSNAAANAIDVPRLDC